jgi:hypothetical protein
MSILTCPACGHWGPADRSETAFEYLARDGLLELRRCRGCGARLLVRFTLFPTEAWAEVLPPEVWEATEESLDARD